MNIDPPQLMQWIGRTEAFTDCISPAPLRALAATLDRDDRFPVPGDEVPPCSHWLFFLPTPRQSEIGPEGHSKRGSYLPPVPLTRRMWAMKPTFDDGPFSVCGAFGAIGKTVNLWVRLANGALSMTAMAELA